jgi:3-O-methylgallate 3,4-dioxygenase
MAEIALGIGTSHGPQLRTPAERWHLFLEKDRKDRRFDYRELLSKAKPEIRNQLSDDIFKIKYDACQAALAQLRDALAAAAPDAVIIIGDDQHEQFWEDNMPMFSIFYGETLEQIPRSAQNRQTWWNSAAAYSDQQLRSFACDVDLARHLIQQFVAQGFDIAASNKLKNETGIGHAFSFVTDHILPDRTIPIVPLMVNAFFPPNRPHPPRCYDLGKALSRALREWRADKKVAIVASGGLSHFIIDEELDGQLLDGLIRKDRQALARLPVDRLWRLGTGEGLNWIVAGGALEQLRPNPTSRIRCEVKNYCTHK